MFASTNKSQMYLYGEYEYDRCLYYSPFEFGASPSIVNLQPWGKQQYDLIQ